MSAVEIRQSTSHTFLLGPFPDSTDGVTPETGLATAMDNATTGIRVSKNGGNMADRNDSTVPTHDEDGFYNIVLDATDTNTLGHLKVEYTEPATCLPAWEVFNVLTANAWDSKYAADVLDVNVIELGGDTQSLIDLKDFADDGYDPATNAITALSATALDLIVSTATGMVEIAKAVWDRVLNGATHNIADSSGRRIRDLQEFGTYEGGSVWIDTVNGTAGTTDFESGTYINPVDSIADANTLAGSNSLVRFNIAPASAITFPGAQMDEIWLGRDWTLGLNGQDITGAFIFGSTVTGVGVATAKYEFEECEIGTVTMDNDGHFETCSLSGTFTIGQAGTFTFHQCFSESASSITIDFAGIGAADVHLFDFHGEINFSNMAAGDTVHITGAGTITTTTCTAGTIDHDGFFEYTDAGGNVTEVQSDIKVAVDEILIDTNELQADDVPGLIAALNNIADSEVLTQVNAALDTAIVELGVAAPTDTPSLRTGLMLLYMALLNKTIVQTSGTDALEIHNAAGTLITQKLLTDDGDDYEEAKMS